MPRMDALRKLTLLIGATLVALSVAVGPAIAQDEPAELAAETSETEGETEGGEEGDRRIALAESPRDRLGLLFLGALVVAGGVGLVNARRQLKGERPSASGEFRWR